MSYFVEANDNPVDIAGAINYLLANLGTSVAGLVPDETTGEIKDSTTGTVYGYLYQFIAVKYADNPQGLNFSNEPTNRLYYGTRNNASAVESLNPADYQWVQVTGGFSTNKNLYYQTNGGRQIQFFAGVSAPGGTWNLVPLTSIDLDTLSSSSGVNGTSSFPLTIYAQGTTTPATPTGGTFTLGTYVLTPPSGWVTTFPSPITAGNTVYTSQSVINTTATTGIATPVWNQSVAAYSAAGATGAPGMDGADGTDGLNAWSATIPQVQYLFAQANDGTYTPESRNIVATFTNVTTTLTALVSASIVANGNITLAYPTPTAGITVQFVGNGTKTTAVMFTHTASNISVGASAVAQVFPVQILDAYGGTNVQVNGATVATVAASPILNHSWSNGQTFSQAPNAGAWTPTPVSSIITTVDTIEVQRAGTVIGRIKRAIAYNTTLGTWTDTADTSSDLNPTRFTLGTATSSTTQYSRSVSYTDPDGTVRDTIQLDVVIGGSRGAPGPANIVRYGRFASRTAAITQGPPQTANGTDTYWYRSPDVFPSSQPYTHTTSQFVSDVTAGAPYKTNLVLSGTAGGSYLPGQQEIQTETITGGHTTSTVVAEISQLMVSGNTGNNPTGVQVGCSIQYFDSSGVAQTFTGNIFLAANLSTQATIGC